jgi:hypothetical protein
MLLSDTHAANFVNRKDCESLFGYGDKFKAVFGSGMDGGFFLHLDRNRS